jgi:hypothetical protein
MFKAIAIYALKVLAVIIPTLGLVEFVKWILGSEQRKAEKAMFTKVDQIYTHLALTPPPAETNAKKGKGNTKPVEANA